MLSAVIDLTYFNAAQGFSIIGGGIGASVSDAGDVNGDTIADVIVGGPNSAQSYVVYGTNSATRGTVNLTTLSAAEGFAINRGGGGVSAAGDVNDDGIADLIVGSIGVGPGNPPTGEAYVIYGKSGTRGPVTVGGNFNQAGSLAAADGFVITGNLTNGFTGWSVSSAGDVNADGVDDVLVAARSQNEAFVIYGVAGSARGALNLGSLTASDGFKITTPANSSVWSVSGAGDINNDGIDDVVIGSPFAMSGGRAFVVYGQAGTTRTTINANSIAASDGFIIEGTGSTGRGVSNAGDVNGDGIDDLIVGANTALGSDPVGPNGGSNISGRAYIVYGQAGSTRGTLNVTSLTNSQGFTVQGNTVYGGAGGSVSAAGDVNGDGLADIIVGADNVGGRSGGEAYVLYGRAGTTRTVIDSASLSPSDGFIVQGEAAFDSTGVSVSGAGDVNNDGFDDLIVGSPRSDSGGVDAGEAYVIYGTATPRVTDRTAEVIDLGALGNAQGFAIIGANAADATGTSVSDAGDINGDGIGDFIVGIPGSDSGGNNSGQTLIVFGKAGATRANLTRDTITSSDGFIIQGNNDDDFAGIRVSGAGDINGDGVSDLIVGARATRVGAENPAAYVIFGQTGATRASIDLSTLAPADGFTVRGQPGSYAGYSTSTSAYAVSGAGDVNGDGFDDLLIGSPFFDEASPSGLIVDSGRAYVLFGKGGATRSDIDLAALPPSDGFAIKGGGFYNYAGKSVSSAGDVNGDGFDDIIVDAGFFEPNSGPATGGSYVIFGGAGATRSDVDLANLGATEGFNLRIREMLFTAGSVSGAGDINGDGIDDVIVGVPFGFGRGTYDGEAYVIYGKLGTTRTVNLSALPITDGFKIEGDRSGDEAGFIVSNAGDFNGDGIDDLLISAQQGDDGGTNAGEAYIVFGKLGTARGTIDLTRLAASDGIVIQGDAAGDRAGTGASAAGDVNNDGVDDIIVGAPGNDAGGNNAGSAYVLFGARPLFSGGNDVAVNSPADQALDGQGGFDQIDMSAFTSTITLNTVAGTIVSAQGGNDTVTNVEFFTLGSGDDVVTLGNTGFVVRTGFGNDTVTGGTARDLISGGDGNDTLSGGTGAANELGGGAGDDLYIVSAVGDSVIEAAGGGNDRINTSLSVFVNKPNVEIVFFTNDTANTGIGLAQRDLLFGSTGRDDLFGRDGDDVLSGGAGAANTLVGGRGDDEYLVNTVGDSIIELEGEGTDLVRTTQASHVLRDHVENLTFEGSTSFIGIGNALANSIFSSTGDDHLSGLGGDDVLTGGAGTDLLIGGDGADTFRFAVADGSVDRVLDFVSGTDKIAVSATGFSASGPIDFVAGTAATSTNATFIYTSGNGRLSFDADGTGAGAAVVIANLGGGLSLGVGDFTFY